MKIKDILESVVKPRSNGDMKNIETQKILFATYSDGVIKNILKTSIDGFEISMAKQEAKQRKISDAEIEEMLVSNDKYQLDKLNKLISEKDKMKIYHALKSRIGYRKNLKLSELDTILASKKI